VAPSLLMTDERGGSGLGVLNGKEDINSWLMVHGLTPPAVSALCVSSPVGFGLVVGSVVVLVWRLGERVARRPWRESEEARVLVAEVLSAVA
jgi:hypothetical protein